MVKKWKEERVESNGKNVNLLFILSCLFLAFWKKLVQNLDNRTSTNIPLPLFELEKMKSDTFFAEYRGIHPSLAKKCKSDKYHPASSHSDADPLKPFRLLTETKMQRIVCSMKKRN